jgi:hypothetical protein
MSGKATLSLVLIAAGAALAAGGPAVFAAVAAFGWQHLHFLLFGVAGVMVLVAAVPRRALAVALVFVVLGSGVVMFRSDGVSDTARVTVAGMLAVLGLLLAVELDRRLEVSLDRRRWTVLFPRRMRARTVPGVIRLAAVTGTLIADLSGAVAGEALTELFLTNWYGHIEVVLPDDWRLVPGRVVGARTGRLAGELDSAEAFEDPGGKDRKRIEELLRADSTPVVVLHLVGFGGDVTLTRVPVPA